MFKVPHEINLEGGYERFPSHDSPTNIQVCYVSALLEMTRYVPDSSEQILRLVMERLIKLDAHLNRERTLSTQTSTWKASTPDLFITGLILPLTQAGED